MCTQQTAPSCPQQTPSYAYVSKNVLGSGMLNLAWCFYEGTPYWALGSLFVLNVYIFLFFLIMFEIKQVAERPRPSAAV